MRPRPADQLLAGETIFQDPTDQLWKAKNASGSVRLVLQPPPDAGGDVQNLPGVQFYVTDANPNLKYPNNLIPVQNDSFWMDLNFPVQTTRNGKKFKPLFAFLVLDLDGRINLNTAGNLASYDSNKQISAVNPTHASNQGVGRHEINLAKVLNADSATTPFEWRSVFGGSPTFASPPTVVGRYGQDLNPCDGAMSCADPYILDLQRSMLFPIDFDAVDNSQASLPTTPHFALPFNNFGSFPTFSAAGSSYDGPYDSYKAHKLTATKTSDPKVNHPLLNQMLKRTGKDMVLGDENMYHVLAGDPGRRTCTP